MRRGDHGRSLFKLLGVLALVVGVLPVLAASASDGLLEIDSDWTLTGNHEGPIVVVADDVTLDCAGWSVVGGGSGDGISVEYRSNVTIRDCVVSGWGEGIDVFQSSGIRIEGVTATGNSVNGIGIDHSEDVLLLENTTYENDSRGIAIFYSEAVAARSNVSMGNGGDGLYATSSEALTVAGNALSENTNNGLRVFFSEAVTASNNTFEGNDSNGVFIGTCETVTLSGNTANGNGISGFKLRIAPGSVIVRNHATGNDIGFEIGDMDSSRFERNDAIDNGTGFLIDRDSDDNLFRFNLAEGSSEQGFSIDFDSDGNMLSHNEAIANGAFGIRDGTVGGTGDSGTDSHYHQNYCWANTAGGSDPIGLCQKGQE